MRNNKVNKIKSSQDGFLVGAFKIIIFIALTIYCLSLLLPIYWLIVTSLKDEVYYIVDNFGLPDKLVFSNFIKAFESLHVDILTDDGIMRIGVFTMLINSLIQAFFSPLVGWFYCVCCAYVLARCKFVGNSIIYWIGIFVMVTPILGGLGSTMLVMRQLGLYDNRLPYMLFNHPCVFQGMGFLMLRASFKSIPVEYSQAAEIDGAGFYRIFLQVILPMVIPTCATLYILSFVSGWNDYSTSLFWLPSYPTLPLGMYLFQLNATGGGGGSSVPVVMAGFFVVLIPSVAIYLASQKLITSNLIVGGLKG